MGKEVSNSGFPPSLSLDELNTYPMSHSQIQLFGKSAHNMVTNFLIEKPFDYDFFLRVMNTITNRHDILKAKFVPGEPGVGCKISVKNNFSIRPRVFNFSKYKMLGDGLFDEVILNLLDVLTSQTFRVEKDDISFDINIVIVGDDCFRVLAVFDHLVFDGKSFGVLEDELKALYVDGKSESDLAEVVKYGYFCHWQAERLSNKKQALDREEFWRKVSGDRKFVFPSVLDVLHKKSARQGTERFSYRLTEDEFKNLKLLKDQLGASYGALFIAMLFKSLGQLGDESDISMVCGFDDRPFSVLDRTIGMFSWFGLVRVFNAGDSIEKIYEQVKKSVFMNLINSPIDSSVNLFEGDFIIFNHYYFMSEFSSWPQEAGEIKVHDFNVLSMTNKLTKSLKIDLVANDVSATLAISYFKSIYDQKSIEDFIFKTISFIR